MMEEHSNISKEQKLKMEKDTEVLQRLRFLVHETFVNNPSGKELLEYWTNQYIFPIVGPSNQHIEYITAAGDFVRQVHALASEHSYTLTKGKE